MKIGRLHVGRNKNIEKKHYIDKNEYRYDKFTDVVPKKKNRLLCIVFSDEKGCSFLLRKINPRQEIDYFRYRNGLYIIDNESIHIASNGGRVAFYLEGISTPIKMSNIEKEIVKMDYLDLYGKKQRTVVSKIKGLKFDAKILDTFANRKFAELFTKQPVDKLGFFMIILGIVLVILNIVTWGVVYYFR